MAPRHEQMMILPAEKRREHFRTAYMIELGRAHAKGGFAWPADRLPEMVDRVMTGLLDRRVPIGAAFGATMKFFGLRTQKALWAFLDAP